MYQAANSNLKDIFRKTRISNFKVFELKKSDFAELDRINSDELKKIEKLTILTSKDPLT